MSAYAWWDDPIVGEIEELISEPCRTEECMFYAPHHSACPQCAALAIVAWLVKSGRLVALNPG